MQPRQILIVAAIAIVGFGAAFGIAGAGGGGNESAAQGTPVAKPPTVIEVEPATVTASVAKASALPALKVPKKKKAAPPETTSGSTPPATNSTPPPTNTTPPPTNTTPPPTNTTPPPTNTTPPPPDDPIIVGGGND
jgi:hypothetical protein